MKKYIDLISNYDKEYEKWIRSTKKLLKRYKGDSDMSHGNTKNPKFNILWSNVQVLTAAVFARLPKPDVSRRFADNDKVGRVASMLIERALEYEITHYHDYRETLEQAITDRFLGGRGIAWVRYEPKIKQATTQITEDEDATPEEILDYECAPTDYVNWADFGHNVARTWDEVTVVWRKVYMSKRMLTERFGEEIAQKIPMQDYPSDRMEDQEKINTKGKALVYELWDKEKNKVFWISKNLDEYLDEREDPLELENFFPCPKPLYATLTSDSLIPVADFDFYRDQANLLDTLFNRIDGLVRSLKVMGSYDASLSTEIARVFTESDGPNLIPVSNIAAYSERGGMRGAIDIVDISPIAACLNHSYAAFDQIKNQIYEITGISDIIRGQSVASETATAQRIKGQYATLRLKSYQDAVAYFATEMLQLKAQIICKHFSPETLLSIASADQLSETDKQLIPQALQLLSNEPMRNFRIEISSDSLVQADEQQEKQDRVEFLAAVGSYIDKAVQASRVAPEITPLLMDLLRFGVTGYRVGRSVEGQIDETTEMLQKQVEQQQMQKMQQQQSDAQANAQPEMQAVQAEQAKAQQQIALKEREMQLEDQSRQQELQMQMMLKKQQMEIDAALEAQRIENDMRLESFKAEIAKERQLLSESLASIKAAQRNVGNLVEIEGLEHAQELD